MMADYTYISPTPCKCCKCKTCAYLTGLPTTITVTLGSLATCGGCPAGCTLDIGVFTLDETTCTYSGLVRCIDGGGGVQQEHTDYITYVRDLSSYGVAGCGWYGGIQVVGEYLYFGWVLGESPLGTYTRNPAPPSGGYTPGGCAASMTVS